MVSGELLLVTVVTGLSLVGATFAVERARRGGRRPAPIDDRSGLPTPAGETGSNDSEILGFGLVAALVVLGGVAVVTDPVTVTFAFLGALIVGYFAWGVYSLARIRGLPKAHSVGVSAWLFGVVLVGAVAVKLLLG